MKNAGLRGVGITGHRFLDEFGGADAFLPALKRVLQAIADLSPHGRLRIVSCLAEGADRLAVQAGMSISPPYELSVPLPMEKEEYEKDFCSAQSVAEFEALLKYAAEVVVAQPSEQGGPHAYAGAARLMLERSDILLAVWDGKATLSIAGTAPTVRMAHEAGIPVIWINALHPDEIWCLKPNGGRVDWQTVIKTPLRPKGEAGNNHCI